MRYVLTAVAALAVGGFFASSASAEPTYYAGGPIQNSGLCQVWTDGDQIYGYLAPCPQSTPAHVAKRSKRQKS